MQFARQNSTCITCVPTLTVFQNHSILRHFTVVIQPNLSQWPRGLRHELSSPSRTLGSWVGIPPKAWVSMCVYSVFVLLYMYVASLRLADPPSKEFYRLCIGSRNWKSSQEPTKYCRAIVIVITPRDVYGSCTSLLDNAAVLLLPWLIVS
jgi:hypothetical protein